MPDKNNTSAYVVVHILYIVGRSVVNRFSQKTRRKTGFKRNYLWLKIRAKTEVFARKA